MIIQISQEYYELLKENVERGAQFLDEQNPQWFNRVDLKNLALSECTTCVLGQLFGDFIHGRDVLSHLKDVQELYDWGVQYGFEAPLDYPSKDIISIHLVHEPAFVNIPGFTCEVLSRYRALTDLWKQAITKRKEQCTT